MKCLCGLRKEYAACCGPYLEGKKKAPTPEALMRSRYTAFAKGNMDYIEKTMRGEALEKFDKASAKAQVGDTEYLKLDVLFSEEEGDRGTVQFIVTFRYQGNEHFMHEISTFEKINGTWYYTKGTVS